MTEIIRRARHRVIARIRQALADPRRPDLVRTTQEFCKRQGIGATDADITAMISEAMAIRTDQRITEIEREMRRHHPRPEDPEREPAPSGTAGPPE